MDWRTATSNIPKGKRGSRRFQCSTNLLGCLAIWWILIGTANAQGKELHVELNKLEDIADGCRVHLVFENRTDDVFSVFKIALVLFDKKGVSSKRLVVDVAPLRSRKTTVPVFDVRGVACGDTGRILINDVIECRDGEAEFQNCVALVTPSSRTDAEFIK